MRQLASLPLALLIMALAVGGLPAQTQPARGGSCATCHGLLDGPLAAPVAAYAQDVHAGQGFGCVACHGGDADEQSIAAMDPARGFIGVPEGRSLLDACGRCHSNPEFMRRYDPAMRVDQVTEYQTSVHGQRLALGDTSVAVCSDCHVAHAIRPASDPRSSVHPLRVATTCGACHADSARMAPYGIPTDQLSKYERSVHWHTLSDRNDLSAPTCNDCHGNHGAAPPGFAFVGNVCGQCHTMMQDLFQESRHAAVFEMMGQPGCVMCHANHEILPTGDEMLGLADGAVCANCHTAEDTGGMAAETMRTLIDSLVMLHDSARGLLERVEQAGVEVSQAQFELRGASDALLRARTFVHRFAVEPVAHEVDSGLVVAQRAVEAGHEGLRELAFRRTGLAASVGIIVLLIVALILTIRNLEMPERQP